MEINKSHFFYKLTPHDVMEALEQMGLSVTGQYIQLNSYENRVFEVTLEDTPRHPDIAKQIGNQNKVIVKLYRPGKWSRDALLEEHSFLKELQTEGLKVIAPIEFENLHDPTLHNHNSIYVSVFPKGLGRMPQELFEEDYKNIGKSLAQLHNVGQKRMAKFRPNLTVSEFGYKSLDLLEDWVSPEVYTRYFDAAEAILDHLEEALYEVPLLRIHGDCHRGNILLSDPKIGDKTYFFVDFDDFINGPVAQDFWMLFSNATDYGSELDFLLSGYEQLRHFPDEQLELFQPLRGLRILHYAAWIAKRWLDPSFPQLFPNFKEYSYWAEEAEALEKIAWTL
jgi:Ser/Thr protein kinase RdoA (MazF antagonist)